MSRKEYRLDSAPPTLGDLRALYSAIKHLDDRLSELQAQMHLQTARMEQDRKYMGQIVSTLNSLIKMMHPVPGDAPKEKERQR
jgi:hypothetical protein